MALDWIVIGLSIFTFLIDLIILIILFKLKSRISGRFNLFFNYFIISIFFLILLRLQSILKNSEILDIYYSREILAFLLSLFLFLAVYNFFRSIVYLAGGNKTEKMKQNYKSYRKKLRKKIARY